MTDHKIIENLLTIALQGASNYWVNSVIPMNKEKETTHATDFINGLKLISADHEYDLSYTDFLLGLECLRTRYPNIYDKIQKQYYDSKDADYWLQCVIFNVIIYE